MQHLNKDINVIIKMQCCSLEAHSHLPVHSSSILPNWDCRQSLTHESISCRDKFSVVTFVEYTLTAIVIVVGLFLGLQFRLFQSRQKQMQMMVVCWNLVLIKLQKRNC